ncbi:4a-hydroxytetrahydrobiopterin dehydratase [Sulfurimonas sp. MAG313]|nr:4a-hydroxytetrahydrobiopterin dehydratase [Sulfurimonas sp. MAG313]MDF1882023.1 4a-hydroxytetrahydrobiopterin dehydratase [Sulfurimonas sp. MAG313]
MRKTCIPCHSKKPQLSKIEISELLEEIPEYELFEIEGIPRISKIYTFKNFKEALAFTNTLGAIAEEENHHPEIILEWGKARVSWWSNSIKGLDNNDFVMAYKTERI